MLSRTILAAEILRMQAEWLQKRITVAEAEARHMVLSDKLGPHPVPFGYQNARWRELIGETQDGDELWEFASSPESWQQLAGRAGIALVRNGEIVASIVTRLN
jgi:hypothetical protein